MNKVTGRDESLIEELTNRLEKEGMSFVFGQSEILKDEWKLTWWEETECCDERISLTVFSNGDVRYTLSHWGWDYYSDVSTLKRFLNIFL